MTAGKFTTLAVLLIGVAALLGAVLLIGVAALLWANTVPKSIEYAGIQIEGRQPFIEQTRRALELLRAKAPEAFGIVQRHVGRIRQAKRSGMDAEADPPTCDMADSTSFYSVTWYAGGIAHESYHSLLFHEYRRAHGHPVPAEVWTGREREMECIQHQIQVMRDIGAAEAEITYLLGQDGTHFDLDGDGVFTWSDYEARDW
jgi:hypothetical protein